MSTVLYIKTNPCETSKTEVTIGNVTVAELSVTALQQAIQAKLGVPIDAQCTKYYCLMVHVVTAFCELFFIFRSSIWRART